MGYSNSLVLSTPCPETILCEAAREHQEAREGLEVLGFRIWVGAAAGGFCGPSVPTKRLTHSARGNIFGCKELAKATQLEKPHEPTTREVAGQCRRHERAGHGAHADSAWAGRILSYRIKPEVVSTAGELLPWNVTVNGLSLVSCYYT